MSNYLIELPHWQSAEESLPTLGEAVLYRTAGHQAFGTYEGFNRWRCSNGELEETPVLKWQPFFVN